MGGERTYGGCLEYVAQLFFCGMAGCPARKRQGKCHCCCCCTGLIVSAFPSAAPVTAVTSFTKQPLHLRRTFRAPARRRQTHRSSDVVCKCAWRSKGVFTYDFFLFPFFVFHYRFAFSVSTIIVERSGTSTRNHRHFKAVGEGLACIPSGCLPVMHQPSLWSCAVLTIEKITCSDSCVLASKTDLSLVFSHETKLYCL